MSHPRPIIALNTTYEDNGDGGISATRPCYWQSILNAGGLPFMLPQLASAEIIKEALERVDGFLLIGGYDIPGERFGQTTLPTAVKMEGKREQTDFALIDALIEMKKPTLAVCLGYQELNVARGGSLYQDLLFDGPASDVCHYSRTAASPRHDVEVTSNSALAEALGRNGKIEVNSSHHQGVAKVGSGLRVTARAADGLVEALELEDHPFFVGVQWHPERMQESPEAENLFRTLINKALHSAC